MYNPFHYTKNKGKMECITCENKRDKSGIKLKLSTAFFFVLSLIKIYPLSYTFITHTYLHSIGYNFLFDDFNMLRKFCICSQLFFDFVNTVKYGGMVFTIQYFTYVGKGNIR